MKYSKSELKQDALELKLINSARKTKRNCLYPDCPNIAIRSHILQENGILNQIAENGKFMDYVRATPYRPAEFILTGINASEMFTFNGFCPTHDTSIFREIENGQMDFDQRRHHLLFAYRGLLNDLFKGVVMTDYLNRIFQSSEISNERKQFFKLKRLRIMFANKDTENFKMLIEKELHGKTNSPNFTFYRFELPRFEIATSTIYGGAFYQNTDLDFDKISKRNPFSGDYVPVSKPIFVNLIPREKSLLFILGHINTLDMIEQIPVTKIPHITQSETFKLLSRILTKIETWGMSEKLHRKLKSQGKLDLYFALRHKWLRNSFNHPEPFQIPDSFNLFGIQPAEILGKSVKI